VGYNGGVRPDPTARWRELLARPEADLPLDEAALLIAAHAQPGLDVDAQLTRLDRLADEAGGSGVGRADADDVAALLFGRLGLAGDRRDYDNPDNSYLNRVLDRRRGLPIALSVLMVEVGRRCGADLEGVGLPGHYVVRDRRHPDTLIDAFNGGRRLDGPACRELLGPVVGADPEMSPASWPAAGPRATLARMLANLDRSFRRRRDTRALAWVTELRLLVPGQPLAVLVEAAGTLAEIGRYDRAAALLEQVAARPELTGETADRLRARAVAARARLN